VPEAIVTGYDGSDGARDALALARRLAEAGGRELVLVCVRAAGDGAGADAASLLEQAAAGARWDVVDEQSVALGLHQYAVAAAAGAIVVGSPERAAPGRIETGTVAERLLHGSPCAVALAPRGYAARGGEPVRRIVVGYTASDEARAALRTAAALARTWGAALRVVTVAPAAPEWSRDVPDYAEAARAGLRDELDRALRALASSVEVEGLVLEGDPAGRVLEQASGWADLIVTGSRGHGPARRVELGSVSTALLAGAEVPVIVTPRGAEAELGEPAAGSQRSPAATR
jgi:nucleotide-binding universal stress UspA family protein